MIRVALCKCLKFNWIRLPARVGVGTTGARGQGPGDGNSISPGGHPAAATASNAASDGEAGIRVVVVGLGFRAIEDSVEGAGGRQRNEAKS
jgi:hypothetical protein